MPRWHVPASTADSRARARDLWSIIWTAGALCWVAAAVVSLLWWQPLSGSYQDGQYVISSAARILHNLLMFLVSACAYRVSLGQGWSASPARRARIVLVHVAVAVVVLRVAPLLQVLAAGLVEGDLMSMGPYVEPWLPLWLPSMNWLALLRFWMPPYALGLLTVALVYIAREYNRESTRLATLSAELANARMAMLSAQLHPHFLFNSLNSIAGLIVENPEQAVTMVARLGDFLRVALESAKRPWTRIEAEVAGLEAYLAIQQTRFRDRLRIEFVVEPATLGAPIPALLLQPIVENAIEHGRSGPDDTLVVAVAVRCEGVRLIITVTNSTPELTAPLSPASFGNGLRIVDGRLRAAYGSGATLVVGPGEPGGTRAVLDLPIEPPPLPDSAAPASR